MAKTSPKDRAIFAQAGGKAATSFWSSTDPKAVAARKKRLAAMAKGRRKAYAKHGAWLTSERPKSRRRARAKAAPRPPA